MVDQQCAANHGHQHDCPVGERLAGEMREDNLRGHAAKDQGHGQAVQDEMVVFEEMRVRRAEPCHGARDKHDQRGPLVDQRQHGLVPRAPGLRDVDYAGRQMRDEEGQEDDRDPEFLQRDLANLCLVRREVVCERGGPDLGAEVAGRADEEAGEDEALCTELAWRPHDCNFLVPVGPLK